MQEDIVSNWMISTSSSWPERERQFARITRAFGLRHPRSETCDTIQGIDYTVTTLDMGPRMYADAWVVSDVALSNKLPGGRRAVFNTEDRYATELVFCAGPNAKPPGTSDATSSMRRTYCEVANRDRAFFETGTAWAVYTALYASALAGCDAVLIPFVSGGLYAGPWRSARDLLPTYRANIERMLMDGLMPDGTVVLPLGRCFRNLYLVTLPGT